MYNPNDYTRGIGSDTMTLERSVSTVLKNVYMWMAAGLAITAILAWFTASTPYYWSLVANNQLWLWGPLVAELGIVIYASARLESMSFTTMMWLMILYAAINGVTMSVILLAYTEESVVTTFATCSATFAAMAFIGHTTNTDMTSWGKYFMMALIGIIIASIANWFMGSSTLASAINYLGVFLFVGLTAYDAQKIKNMVEYNYQSGAIDMRKLALWGSLSLYLDFINMFIYLLRIMGSRRD